MAQLVKNIFQNIFNNSSIFYNNFILKNINVRLIILYIIAFFISMVGFSNELNPFAIAMLGAFCSLNIPVGILVLVSAIATYLKFGAVSTIMYVITAILFISTIMIAKPKKIIGTEENEKIRLAKYLVIATSVVQVLKLCVMGMLVYNILQSILYVAAVYIFYKIFVNSVGVIRGFGIKKVFSIEELIGTSLLLAIAISAFGDTNIYGISICNVLCIFIIMVMGWKNGMLVGATLGVTIGVTIGLIFNEEPILIAIYAFSGLLSGILCRFGKIGVIIGFILGNVILTYISNGNTSAIIHLREIFIASIGLILIPKKIEAKLNDIMGDRQLFQYNKERLLEESKDTIYKLNSFSNTLNEIAKTYDTDEGEKFQEKLEKENLKIFMEEVLINIESAKDNLIYEDIVNTKNNILKDIYIELCRTDELSIYDLVKIFEKNNKYIIDFEENIKLKNDIETITKVINYTYQISKMNFIWKQKVIQSRRNVSNELNGVSKVINTIAEDIDKKFDEKYNDLETEIRLMLKTKNIKLKNIKLKKEKNNKYNIFIYLSNDLQQDNKNIIEKILSDILKQEIKYEKTEEIDKKNILQKYSTKDKYMMQIGMSKLTKNNYNISGDSYIKTKLEDGKYLIAISDGMGSGKEAKRSSEIALKMLEKLLKEGFDKEASINLINSTINLNTNEELYATLDIAILDLFEGNIECIKNAACPTFVKSGKEVSEINSIGLPAGILEKIDFVVYEKDLKENDIIIMCSDGLLDSKKENSNWLKNTLENMETINVQKIADILISEAKDNSMGIAKDDMIVIVLRIVKK